MFFQLIFESAWRASIVPFSTEAAFYAMAAFGEVDMRLAMLAATMGAGIGHSFNWLSGQIFLIYQERDAFALSAKWYEKLARLFKRGGFLLLPLCWMPMVNGLGFLAGFFGLRYRWFLPLVLLGEAAHYAYFLSRQSF